MTVLASVLLMHVCLRLKCMIGIIKEVHGKGSAATQFKVVTAPQSALNKADLSLTAFEIPSDLLIPHQSLINPYYKNDGNVCSLRARVQLGFR